ncbi:hypothetical protein GGI42DRAFT_354644 [Trichoderma sp. SZMC 28013]
MTVNPSSIQQDALGFMEDDGDEDWEDIDAEEEGFDETDRMADHYWRNKLAAACRQGMEYPEKPLPDASLLIGALLESIDESLLSIHLPPLRAAGHIGRRLKISLGIQNEQSVCSDATPSTQRQLVLQGQENPRVVQHQAIVVSEETTSPAYPSRRETLIREPEIRTELNSEEYGELVKRLWKGEGTKKEITAHILNESHQKALEDFRERRDHPERWERRQRQIREECRQENRERRELHGVQLAPEFYYIATIAVAKEI